MDLLLGFVVAIGVTMALIPPLIKLAPRLRFIDLPQTRKVHDTPIPRVGGIAMAAGVLLALLVSGQAATSSAALVYGILVLVIFGVWDDRATLSAGTKFIGQTIAVLIVMFVGDVSIGSITLADRLEMPHWIALPMTFLFLVGATNAINLADGLDGLAGGTTLMCMAGLALLAFTVGSAQVGGVALLVIGAVIGFLRFNTYPARVFMGDTGSQLLGFTAAVLCVMLTQDPSAPLSSALPLLLLGVPMIDTLWVMIGRVVSGHSPFKADRNHIHHRLLALGFDHHEAVMIIYIAQAGFFAAGWWLRYESDVTILLSFVVFAAAMIAPLETARRYGWRWRSSPQDGRHDASALHDLKIWLADANRLPLWSVFAIAISISVFALTVLFHGERNTLDVTVVAAVTAAVLATNIAVRWKSAQLGWIDKVALYLSVVLFVFLNESAAAADWWQWLPVGVTLAGVCVRMRLSTDRRFVVTPLDVLVIIAAALIPNLPDSIASTQALGTGIAKLVVLFYGVETLSVVAQTRWKWLSVAVLVALIALALQGV